jgi:hypothetical protein
MPPPGPQGSNGKVQDKKGLKNVAAIVVPLILIPLFLAGAFYGYKYYNKRGRPKLIHLEEQSVSERHVPL